MNKDACNEACAIPHISIISNNTANQGMLQLLFCKGYLLISFALEQTMMTGGHRGPHISCLVLMPQTKTMYLRHKHVDTMNSQGGFRRRFIVFYTDRETGYFQISGLNRGEFEIPASFQRKGQRNDIQSKIITRSKVKTGGSKWSYFWDYSGPKHNL